MRIPGRGRMLANAAGDREQLEEHRERMPDWMHPALRRVDPPGGDLDDPIAGVLRPVEDLDVEAEAAGLQRGKDALGHLGRKRLEAALRVPDAAQHEDSDQ